MKREFYLKLQSKFGGKWVATSKAGMKVYAAAADVDELFKKLEEQDIKPQNTVIGFIEELGAIRI